MRTSHAYERWSLILVFADKLASKAQKITIKLPWEIMTMFSDVLATDDEEDEDDIEAHEASIQRLKVRLCSISARISVKY